MSGPLGFRWHGRRRSIARVLVLFVVTAGVYWPVWLAQVLPTLRKGARTATGLLALAAALLVPGVNVLFEIALALLLPRALRRIAERDPGRPAVDAEVQTFLLLAAPFTAIALALALHLPAWLVGYLAWPLELPATLVVQHTLNRLEPSPQPAARGPDGEVLASAAIATAIAVGVVLAIALGGGSTSRPSVRAQVDLVSDVAATPGAVWITRIVDDAVEQIDRSTLKPTGKRVHVGRSPYDIAFGFGDLWVADFRSDSVSRVDPRGVRVKGGLIPTGRGPFGVATGYGRVWVTNEIDRNVVAIDPKADRVRKRINVGLGPRGVAVGEGAVWVAGAGSSSVVRVDPRTGATRRVFLPGLCQDVAVGGGSVWAALPQASTVVRIDPIRMRRIGLIPVGLGPASLVYGGGVVWVASGDGTVTRIDARSGIVKGKPIPVAKRLNDVTVSGRSAWVLGADGVVRHLVAP